MARKKKILIASDNFLPRWDGVTRFILEILTSFEKNFDVTLLAPDFGEINQTFRKSLMKTKLIKIPVYNKKIGDFQLAKPKLSKIKEAVKSSDAVFVQTIGTIGYLTIKYAKKFKKPIFGYTHSLEWKLVIRSINPIFIVKQIIEKLAISIARNSYNKCDIIFVPYEYHIKELEKYGITARKKVVNLGVNTTAFNPKISKTKMKEELGLSNDFVIGYVGRIANEKDIPTLYRAFKKVQRDKTNVKLLIVGSGLKSLENRLRKDSSVILVGSTDNPEKYYAAMNIYVLPSLLETTSLTTLEAMATGLPVIVTPVGMLNDYINRDVNGLFFPRRNSDVLASKIIYLMENKDFANKLGKEARKTALKFSWRKTCDRLVKLITKYTEEKSHL